MDMSGLIKDMLGIVVQGRSEIIKFVCRTHLIKLVLEMRLNESHFLCVVGNLCSIVAIAYAG